MKIKGDNYQNWSGDYKNWSGWFFFQIKVEICYYVIEQTHWVCSNVS